MFLVALTTSTCPDSGWHVISDGESTPKCWIGARFPPIDGTEIILTDYCNSGISV